MKKTIALLSFFLALVVSTYSQTNAPLHIQKAKGAIKIDGVMDEADWESAEVAGNFRQYFPFDSSYAETKTEVRVTYDDHFIYVFAVMKKPLPGNM